jgi:hypothetical protein
MSTPGGGGANAFTFISQEADPGLLIAVSIFTDNTTLMNYQTYVTAWICRGTPQLETRAYQLLAGYPRAEMGLSWNGLIELKANDFFYWELRGNLNPVFRFIDQRITGTTEGELKKYVRAVLSTPPVR